MTSAEALWLELTSVHNADVPVGVPCGAAWNPRGVTISSSTYHLFVPRLERDRHDGVMHYVKAVALRWASDDFPGWVEIAITDASGTEWRIVEKQPVVDARDELTVATSYPVVIEVACEVVSSEVDLAGSSVVTIALDHGIEHQEAGSKFRVREDQVVSRRS